MGAVRASGSRFAHGLTATALIVGLGLAGLSGCSFTNDTAASSASGTNAESRVTQAASIEAIDVWAKAASHGDMSAMFGRLTNRGSAPITIVSVEAPESPEMQLHTTIMGDDGSMTMQEKEGGFTIEPGAALTLEPGGDHLMYMGLTADLKAGADATATLTFADGSTLDLTGLVREYAGANEEYMPEHSMGDDSAAGDFHDHDGH